MAGGRPSPPGLVDDRGARIVADGIYATNEARLDADETYLYVAETMKARILRFPVRSDGSLGEREVFGPDGLGLGGFVDGFTFDAEGNLWVTTVVRNGIGVLTRDGDWHVVLEDPREDVLATFVDKLAAGAATPEDMLAAAGPRLQFPTSVCFAGPDLRTAYVGSLAMSRLPTFRAPVTGPEPSERSPAGPLLGQHRQLAAEQIIRPNRQAGRGRTATAAPHSRSGRLVARRRSAAPAPPTGRPGFMRPPTGHQDLNDRA